MSDRKHVCSNVRAKRVGFPSQSPGTPPPPILESKIREKNTSPIEGASLAVRVLLENAPFGFSGRYHLDFHDERLVEPPRHAPRGAIAHGPWLQRHVNAVFYLRR